MPLCTICEKPYFCALYQGQWISGRFLSMPHQHPWKRVIHKMSNCTYLGNFMVIGGWIKAILYQKVNHYTKERKHERGGWGCCFCISSTKSNQCSHHPDKDPSLYISRPPRSQQGSRCSVICNSWKPHTFVSPSNPIRSHYSFIQQFACAGG